jgi:UV DNA damage endonuclease
MKIGYVGYNTSFSCRPNEGFRLASYTEDRLRAVIQSNLECLKQTILFNIKHNIQFFRISSETIPFASHPVMTVDWASEFEDELVSIGKLIREGEMRISMHPGQFTVLNSPKADVVGQSIRELDYHARLLDALGLDTTAKIQVHLGGVYGNKNDAVQRFAETYRGLTKNIKQRLVIENDDMAYSLQDCLKISSEIDIPLVFDTFHHDILNNGEDLTTAVERASGTWKESDGVLMVDYSSQMARQRQGKHTDHIDLTHWDGVYSQIRQCEFDVMLEIKDKEQSALKLVQYLNE